jgi:hypothetical protein
LFTASIGARASVTGSASHHQAEAMIVREMRRSASGARTAIGSILQKACRLWSSRQRGRLASNTTPDRDSKLSSPIKAVPFNNK